MTRTQIELGDGFVAVIDRIDLALVSGFEWRPLVQMGTEVVYAHAWHRHLHIYMHRLIIGAGPTERVDHANGDGLDNRLLNLRIATPSENGANRPKDTARTRAAFSSDYKGVYWDKSRGRWVAIIHDGKSRSLGRFSDEEEAARAYDQAAVQVWGEYARTNF